MLYTHPHCKELHFVKTIVSISDFPILKVFTIRKIVFFLVVRLFRLRYYSLVRFLNEFVFFYYCLKIMKKKLVNRYKSFFFKVIIIMPYTNRCSLSTRRLRLCCRSLGFCIVLHLRTCRSSCGMGLEENRTAD